MIVGAAAAAVGPLAAGACTLSIPAVLPDDDALDDAGAADEPGRDASPDGEPAASPVPVAAFDLAKVSGRAAGYHGGVYDGAHVYLVPSESDGGVAHGVVARHDVARSVDDVDAWETFDVATVRGGAVGYFGGAFDGRYLYLVPGRIASDAYVARYDTTAPFGVASSWSTFDVTDVEGGAYGFRGAVFDGRYLYLVPHSLHVAVRYDTTAPFDQLGSWAHHDPFPATGAEGFVSGVFDGTYVYFVPFGGASPSGTVLRYDRAQPFTAGAAWTTFDVASLDPRATGFHGGVFDGRYLYLVPRGEGTAHGVLARYDTTGGFGGSGAWRTVDLAAFDARAVGYRGGAFDGRYVYLVPGDGGPAPGLVARLDTASPDPRERAAWTFIDAAEAAASGALDGGGAPTFAGSAFDGKHLYLAPSPGSTVVRLLAHDEPFVSPATYGGSFF